MLDQRYQIAPAPNDRDERRCGTWKSRDVFQTSHLEMSISNLLTSFTGAFPSNITQSFCQTSAIRKDIKMTTLSDESLPPRSSLLTNLTTQTSLLTTLFTLLSQPSSSSAASTSTSNPHPGVSGTNSTSIPALYSALEAQTAQMRSITQNLYTHQKAWAGLKRKEAEVGALEERVRGLVRELERGRGELEGLVKDGRGVKKGIEGLEKGKSFLLGSVLLSLAGPSGRF